MLDLCNDLNRIVAIYGLSVPISKALGVINNIDHFRADLLNDMLSLMFYYEIIVRQGISAAVVNKIGVKGPLVSDLVKTAVLILASSALSGKFNLKTLLFTLVGVVIYHEVVRPIILNQPWFAQAVDFEAVEDIAESIILLSIVDNNPIDTGAKLLGLLTYHKTMKLIRPK